MTTHQREAEFHCFPARARTQVHGHLLKTQPPGAVERASRDGRVALVCAALAMVSSPWIGSWGFLVYTVPPLVAALRRRGRGSRRE